MNLVYLLQNVPPGPGAGDPGPAAPGPAPAGDAHTSQPPPGAGGPPPGGLSQMFPLLIVVPMLAVMFFMSRSQQKKQKEMETKLKAGDRVVTQSGIIGKLTEKDDRTVKIEIAPGIKVKMVRTAIVGLDTSDEPAASAKAK